MNNARTRFLCLAWTVLLLAAACSDKSSSQSTSTNDLTGAYDHLHNALAACANSASQCSKDADDTQQQSCRSQEASCRQDAGSHASGELTDAIQACIDLAKRCTGDSGVSSVGGVCRDSLESCLYIRTADDDDDHDDCGGPADGSAGDGRSSVHACVEDLRACVLADRSAEQCAEEVSGCVVASAPGQGSSMGQSPDDAGMSGASHDPHADAGTSGAPHDAGMSGESHEPPVDAGMSGGSHEPPADAGTPTARDCQAVYDACIQGNGSRQVCSHMQRDCERQNAP